MWIVLMLALSVGVGQMAVAAPESDLSLKAIVDKGYLVVGLDDTFPPMGFRDESGELVGFDIDLAREVTDRMGAQLRLQPIVWNAKEQALSAGEIDCIWSGMTITPARLQSMSISVAYMGNEQCLIVKSDSEIYSLDDIAGKWLGLQAGSSAEDAQLALDEAPDFRVTLSGLQSFVHELAAIKALDDGLVDAVLLDKFVADYVMAKNPDKYEMLPESLALGYLGVGFRKDDIALTNAVNEALTSMAEDGTLADISTHWFGEDVTTVSDPPDDPAFMSDAVVDEEDVDFLDDYEEGDFEDDDEDYDEDFDED